ncbi:GNAT family N-acetyltransferase [Microbacterium sp. 2P01SA-2]|uniref:GNAT family N-acetyltransferase n=1 Tax=unclassified Microbacterium TaxID=2609290 RepID=UPI0039A09730
MNTSDSPTVSLRPYRSADAAATLAVFTEAITQTAAAHYTSQQIDAWARPGRRDLPSWDEAMSGRASVVAVVGDEVVGFSDVDGDGYIDMLFVSPRHLRRGIARTLLGFVEQRSRSAATPELTSDVSIAARPFFESVGFHVVREQHPVKEGVELTNYRMRKVLSPSATAAS